MLHIKARLRDIGGMQVGRLLPFHSRRLVGPFIFFDHLGPADIAPGQARAEPAHAGAQDGVASHASGQSAEAQAGADVAAQLAQPAAEQ